MTSLYASSEKLNGRAEAHAIAACEGASRLRPSLRLGSRAPRFAAVEDAHQEALGGLYCFSHAAILELYSI